MIRDLEIRSITKDDLENVIELDNASFPEPWSKSLWNVELSRNQRIYLGAFQKKELVGFIGGLLAHTDFHITTVATKESIRNLGVGSVILFEMLHQILGLSAEVTASHLRCGLQINQLKLSTGSLVLPQSASDDPIIKTMTKMPSLCP